MVLNLSHIKY